METLETILKNAGIDDRLTMVKVRYALEILRNEGIKLIILFVVFALFGKQADFVAAALILMPIRVFSGGMHMKSNVSCFVYSFAFFLLSVLLLPLIPMPTALLFSQLTASVVLIAAISPVASHKRPFRTEARRTAMKKMTLIVLAIDFAALILLWRFAVRGYFVIGVWAVTLQAIQLYAAWAYRKKKGVKDAEKSHGLEADASGRDSVQHDPGRFG